MTKPAMRYDPRWSSIWKVIELLILVDLVRFYFAGQVCGGRLRTQESPFPRTSAYYYLPELIPA